jgi:hypothetical protein
MGKELWVLVGLAAAIGIVGLLYGIFMVVTALIRTVSPVEVEESYKDPRLLQAEYRVAVLMRDSKYEPVAARGRRLRVTPAVAQGSLVDDTGDARTETEREKELTPASAEAH